jgi:hypothetical protein
VTAPPRDADPASRVELADSGSQRLLVVLERLTLIDVLSIDGADARIQTVGVIRNPAEPHLRAHIIARSLRCPR